MTPRVTERPTDEGMEGGWEGDGQTRLDGITHGAQPWSNTPYQFSDNPQASGSAQAAHDAHQLYRYATWQAFHPQDYPSAEESNQNPYGHG